MRIQYDFQPTYCPEGPQELPTFVIAIIFDSRSTRISLNWKKFTDTSLVSHETWLRCHNSKKSMMLQLLIKFGNYENSINPKKLWFYGIEFDFMLMLFFSHYYLTDKCLVLLQVPKCFVPVQIFWDSPKIWLHLVPLQKLLCRHKNQFYWMQIIFLYGTKCL